MKRWFTKSVVGRSFGSKKTGPGRKIKEPEMESSLFQWCNDLQRKGVTVTARMVKAKAMELSRYKDFAPNK
jgi:hypothetical protein